MLQKNNDLKNRQLKRYLSNPLHRKTRNFPIFFFINKAKHRYQNPTKITQKKKTRTQPHIWFIMKNSKWNISIWNPAGQFPITPLLIGNLYLGYRKYIKIIHHINSSNTSYVLGIVLSALHTSIYFIFSKTLRR